MVLVAPSNIVTKQGAKSLEVTRGEGVADLVGQRGGNGA
jgi:hypothetical protein